MPRANVPLYALSGGEINKSAAGRIDLQRNQYAAQFMENWLPTVIGKMTFRPGFEFLSTSVGTPEGKRIIPFIRSVNTSFVLEVSENELRILFDREYIQNEAVTNVLMNGDFDAFDGWVSAGDGGTAEAVDGMLRLLGSGTGDPIARQSVMVDAADVNTEHSIDLEVKLGPVLINVGSTEGGDDLLSVTAEEGSHILSFDPEGATQIWVELVNERNSLVLVDRCQILSDAGPIVVRHPWLGTDLASLRFAQSIDVIFVASAGFQQRRIERRGMRSWSIVRYKVDNGPFEIQPVMGTTLTPSVADGFGTMTASRPYFMQSDVGSLLRLQHSQQREQGNLDNAEDVSDPIRIAGVGNSRIFNVEVTVPNGAEIVLERAFDEPLNYQSFRTYNSNTTQNVDDNLDNQIVFYRVRLATEPTDPMAQPTYNLFFSGGITLGVARITSFVSETEVEYNTLTNFGATTATAIWDTGTWSDREGWPNTITFFDGRIWWGRQDMVYGSVSDDFANYSDEVEGDSAPVIRSVGSGPEEGIVWLLPTQRLLAGTDESEISIRASSFDEPITPTNFVPRDASTRGCDNIQAVKVDTAGIFVQKGGERVYQLTFVSEQGDYVSFDLTELNPEICRSGVRAMAVQRNPDTIIWFVLGNGQMRALTLEPSEEVLAWARVNTQGNVQDVIVIPGSPEDQVIILVEREFAGPPPTQIQRIERLASTQDVVGGTINKCADSFVQFANDPPSNIITGLDHLNGSQVVVWADGSALLDLDSSNTDPYKRAIFTVSAGAIDVGSPVGEGIVGLSYMARWQSVKPAYAAARGTALLQRKRFSHLGLYLNDTALGGVRIGDSFSDLQSLRRDYRGRFLGRSEVLSEYDYDASQFNGTWSTDSRIHIEAAAPFPATVVNFVMSINTKDLDG